MHTRAELTTQYVSYNCIHYTTLYYTRCNVLALHSLPGSAGYRLLHPRLDMYDLCGFSRPLRRPASPESFCFVVKLGCSKVEE